MHNVFPNRGMNKAKTKAKFMFGRQKFIPTVYLPIYV